MIDDSFYKEANDSVDNPNDLTYKPSDETLQEAEKDATEKPIPAGTRSQTKVKVDTLNLMGYASFVEPDNLEEHY